MLAVSLNVIVNFRLVSETIFGPIRIDSEDLGNVTVFAKEPN